MEIKVQIKVHLTAYSEYTLKNETRIVDIPAQKAGLYEPFDEEKLLKRVFHYGQNDVQRIAGTPSVSVGDVIDLSPYFKTRWRVKPVGFTKLVEVPEAADTITLDTVAECLEGIGLGRDGDFSMYRKLWSLVTDDETPGDAAGQGPNILADHWHEFTEEEQVHLAEALDRHYS